MACVQVMQIYALPPEQRTLSLGCLLIFRPLPCAHSKRKILDARDLRVICAWIRLFVPYELYNGSMYMITIDPTKRNISQNNLANM